MKTFNKFEKIMIDKIVNNERLVRNITNILDDYLDKTRIDINVTRRTVDLKFEIQGAQPTQIETDWIIKQKLPEIQI